MSTKSSKNRYHGNLAFAGSKSERARRAARDRVMLYLRGMDIGALLSLELAAETMRRAGPDAQPDEVMAQLHDLLHKRNPDIFITDAAGRRLSSMPPLNRQPMLSEKIGGMTLVGAGKKLLAGAWGKLPLKDIRWDGRRA